MKAKKLWSLLLVTALTASLLAGCGGKKDEQGAAGNDTQTEESGDVAGGEEGYSTEIDMEEEPYTVAIQVVTLPGTQFEGEEEREAAINAITEPAINCKVDIQEVWISEIANTTSMAIAGDEKIDLVHVATVQTISSMVGSEMLYDMNEGNLLQNRGQKLVELFGDLLATGNVAGQQLAVPAKIYNANARGIGYNKTMADALGITIPDTITWEDLDKILYEVHEKNPDVMTYYTGSGELNYLYWLQGYATYGTESSYGVILDPNNSTTIENLYATDLFKDYCLKAWQWTQDGIQPGDPTDTSTAQDYFNAQKLFCVVGTINEEQATTWGATAAQNGFECAWSQLVGPTIGNADVTEYMWGIASNSERPDKAMDFLNFLYSNAEVGNILKYGLEGVNYNFAEGSDKIIIPNGSYLPLFYQGGNYAEMLIQAPAGEDYIQKMEAMNAAATVSPLCGYMFDDSAFQTESSVIYSTILEYLPRLQNGMCESEEATLALIDEFNAKLEASGINDVIAENQTQLNEYLEIGQ